MSAIPVIDIFENFRDNEECDDLRHGKSVKRTEMELQGDESPDAINPSVTIKLKNDLSRQGKKKRIHSRTTISIRKDSLLCQSIPPFRPLPPLIRPRWSISSCCFSRISCPPLLQKARRLSAGGVQSPCRVLTCCWAVCS